MCVIAYKPMNVAFPEESVLRNCFDNNPDGAGFMYAFNRKVIIRKGYTTFESFKQALNRARSVTGDKVPYVMHFRIATQGYEKTMTHPFPLSSKMSNLKRTKTECNIGVAHNGIIQLTSDGSKDYSDTMLFITDYLSLIIRNYSWYKDDRTVQLIENLIDSSRLAILDKNGHCKLIGQTWEECDGVWYSNNSYSYKKQVYSYKWNDWDYDDWGDTWNRGIWSKKVWSKKDSRSKVKETPESNIDYYAGDYDDNTGEYDFDETYCPEVLDNDSSYCGLCANRGECTLCNSRNLAEGKKVAGLEGAGLNIKF